jgi:hypothetical protein
MDPEVAGLEYRARANSRDSRALLAAAKAGHTDVCKLLMDPEVAGHEYWARANSRDNRALREAANAGHADVCNLLMDPEVAGPVSRAIVNLDSS